MKHNISQQYKKLQTYLRSLLSEEGVREIFLTYNVGVEIINILDSEEIRLSTKMSKKEKKNQLKKNNVASNASRKNGESWVGFQFIDDVSVKRLIKDDGQIFTPYYWAKHKGLSTCCGCVGHAIRLFRKGWQADDVYKYLEKNWDQKSGPKARRYREMMEKERMKIRETMGRIFYNKTASLDSTPR